MKKTYMALFVTVCILLSVFAGCSPKSISYTKWTGGTGAIRYAQYTHAHLGLTPTEEWTTLVNPKFTGKGTLFFERDSALDEDGMQNVRVCCCDSASGEEEEVYTGAYSYTQKLVDYAVSPDGETLWICEYSEEMESGEASFTLAGVDIHTKEKTAFTLPDSLGQLGLDMRICAASKDEVYGIYKRGTGKGRAWAVFVYNKKTDSLSTKECPGLESPSLVLLSTGEPAVVAQSAWMPIAVGTENNTANSLGEDISIDQAYSGSGEFLFYFVSDGNIYGYSAEKNAVQLLSLWENGVLFAEGDLLSVCVSGETYACVLKGADGGYDSYTLAPAAAPDAPKLLTVACYGESEELKAAAAHFNRDNPDYTVQIVDYYQPSDISEMNNGYTVPAGMLRLNTALLADRTIDILCLDNASTNALLRQGALLDLYPLIDADPDLTRDDFTPGVLEALEVESALPCIASGFEINTVSANRDVAGPVDHLTLEKWRALISGHREAIVLDNGYTRINFIQMVAQGVFADYIDAGRSSCHFNDGKFAQYLVESKTFMPYDELEKAVFGGEIEKTLTSQLVSGECLFKTSNVTNFMMYQRLISDAQGQALLVGYPTEVGSGHFIRFSNNMGIMAYTPHVQAAWDFLKLCLEDTLSDRGQYTEVFPTDRALFEKQAEYYGNDSNFNRNGTREKTLEGNPLCALTDEDMTMLSNAIKAAKPIVETDEQIRMILLSEASYYWADQITAEEAVNNIQQRVSLYLKEQS